MKIFLYSGSHFITHWKPLVISAYALNKKLSVFLINLVVFSIIHVLLRKKICSVPRSFWYIMRTVLFTVATVSCFRTYFMNLRACSSLKQCFFWISWWVSYFLFHKLMFSFGPLLSCFLFQVRFHIVQRKNYVLPPKPLLWPVKLFPVRLRDIAPRKETQN